MSKYYFMTWKEMGSAEVTAYPLRTENLLRHELIPELEGKYEMPFDFILKKIVETKKGLIVEDDLTGVVAVWVDYPGNKLAWPIMSERMKQVVEESLSGEEGVEWISAKIRGNGEERIYYIPRFTKKLDVLDIEETIFFDDDVDKDHIIRPCFSSKKIANLHLFNKPECYDFWKITRGLYVNETLKKAIQKEKLTGVKFNKTLVN